MFSVSDVLRAAELELTLVTGSTAALNRGVRWAAVTELPDPTPFLSGGELILTTGLKQQSATSQRQFVQKIAGAGAVALGFGTGLTHRRVPSAVIAQAATLNLPVLEVPYSVPFLAIDRFVADQVLAQYYRRSTRLLETYDQLSRAVLSADALDGLISRLHSAIGAPVAVIGLDGEVLSSTPRSAVWPSTQILGGPGTDDAAGSDGAVQVRPVELQGVAVGYLCSRPAARLEDVLPYAVSLVGLELSRRQAVLEGRRLLLAEVLGDVVAGRLADDEAARRLAGFEIDVAQPNAVVIGYVPEVSGDRLRRLAGGPLPLVGVPTAWIGDQLVAVVNISQRQSAQEAILAHLSRVAPGCAVGIGSPHVGLSGLRWSFHEASQALSLGPGVHQAQGLSLAGLLAASQDVPLKDLAAETLRPLTDFDLSNQADLVLTLRTFLELDGSVSRVAETLMVHRNTVRYRLDQISRLSGRGVDTTADRLQWYLALLA